MNYEPIYMPNGQNGHKVFREMPSGRIVIADFSGSLPHGTDDGPLYPDPKRPISLTVHGGKLSASLPLLDRRDDHVWTLTTAATAIAVIRSVPGFKVEHEPGLTRVLDAVEGIRLAVEACTA